MRPERLAQKAKGASDVLAHASTDEKNGVLERLADALGKNQDYLYEENMKDVRAAEKEGMAKSLIDRLRIDDKLIREMQGSLRDVAALPDPVGEIVKVWKRPNNLLVGRMRIPIGVILIIYESRPNVTIEAFSLCLKSGNCVILKGGSEAYHSNRALYRLIVETLKGSKISPDAVQFVDTADRDYIYTLLEREEEIDLVIPRGGEALIRNIVERSRIPVLKHYKGVCHIFVDRDADLEKVREALRGWPLEVVATGFAIHLMERGHSKMAGVRKACELIGLNISQVAAFGDADNDEEMLRECGHGVAVANGSDKAKAAADLVTRGSHAEGVQEGLRRLGLI